MFNFCTILRFLIFFHIYNSRFPLENPELLKKRNILNRQMYKIKEGTKNNCATDVEYKKNRNERICQNIHKTLIARKDLEYLKLTIKCLAEHEGNSGRKTIQQKACNNKNWDTRLETIKLRQQLHAAGKKKKKLPKAFSNLLSGSLEGLKPCRGELINIFSWTNRYRELLTKN
ncbi:hypothetical protein PUN28_010870 [Cardiocondyla obscurior]|uniref:Uncharacterized protein n=1 Tax=Cardiocondyla obscurior TaxID=286306 RepID=A0AAW2FII8_9HYME